MCKTFAKIFCCLALIQVSIASRIRLDVLTSHQDVQQAIQDGEKQLQETTSALKTASLERLKEEQNAENTYDGALNAINNQIKVMRDTVTAIQQEAQHKGIDVSSCVQKFNEDAEKVCNQYKDYVGKRLKSFSEDQTQKIHAINDNIERISKVFQSLKQKANTCKDESCLSVVAQSLQNVAGSLKKDVGNQIVAFNENLKVAARELTDYIKALHEKLIHVNESVLNRFKTCTSQ